MELNTRGRYAVMAIADLARACADNASVPLSAISERQMISLAYLEQLFGKLRRANLVRQRTWSGRWLSAGAASLDDHGGRSYGGGGRKHRYDAVWSRFWCALSGGQAVFDPQIMGGTRRSHRSVSGRNYRATTDRRQCRPTMRQHPQTAHRRSRRYFQRRPSPSMTRYFAPTI